MNVKLSYENCVKLMRAIIDFQYKSMEENLVIPANISYAMFKNEKSLNRVYEEFEKYRLLLIDTYGKKDKKGNTILNEEKKYEIELKDKFDKEFKTLCQREVSIEIHKFLKVDASISGLEGNQNTLSLLWSIIDAVNELGTVKKKAKKEELITAE
jgi:hypothetical protein